MNDKRPGNYPAYTNDADDFTSVVCSGELTGLEPRPPADDSEQESYTSLYSTPKPMEALLRATNSVEQNRCKPKPPKRILPM